MIDGCCSPSKAEKIMERGSDMMDIDLNLIKIVKNLKDIKLHLKAKGIMNKTSKVKARNSGSNIIYLEETISDSSDSSQSE